MFAVVKIGSSQYLVNPGQELLVDYLGKVETKLTLDQILLVVDDQQVTVGKPLVTGILITAEVLGHPLGDKIRIGKFKAKSRYRKVTGFRPHYTRIKIIDIKAQKAS
jgi:large subunit ribosomal protein L21